MCGDFLFSFFYYFFFSCCSVWISLVKLFHSSDLSQVSDFKLPSTFQRGLFLFFLGGGGVGVFWWFIFLGVVLFVSFWKQICSPVSLKITDGICNTTLLPLTNLAFLALSK